MPEGITLWRIGVDAPAYEAHDLGGKGAERSGGRWNRPGRPLVYASTSIALACLETVVHLGGGDLPLNRYLVRIDVPGEVWTRRIVRESHDLPLGWDAVPEGKVSLDLGDAWLRGLDSALLVVPSAIVPEEANVLINPVHPQAATLQAMKRRRWLYDGRLLV